MVSMVEIYNIDIGSHERFARDQKEIEAFQRQYHISPSQTGLIAAQTKVLDFIPKHNAVDLLLRTFQRTSWARFSVPKNFHMQRLLSSYVAPSLGSQEAQRAALMRILNLLDKERGKKQQDSSEEEEEEDSSFEEEAETLVELIEKGIIWVNEEVDFVLARMRQFIQA